jgi:hypothetical protein
LFARRCKKAKEASAQVKKTLPSTREGLRVAAAVVKRKLEIPRFARNDKFFCFAPPPCFGVKEKMRGAVEIINKQTNSGFYSSLVTAACCAP